MLCSRSASLTSSTRTSSAMASRSLRRFSACLASRDTRSSFFSLVRPSTRWPMSGPKIWSISARVVGVSSIVSCSSAAAIVASSSLRSVRMAATSSGWEKYGSPEARLLLAMRLHGVDVGAVEQGLVGVGVVAAHPLDQVVLPHHRRGLGRFFRPANDLRDHIQAAFERRPALRRVLHARQIGFERAMVNGRRAGLQGFVTPQPAASSKISRGFDAFARPVRRKPVHEMTTARKAGPRPLH